MQGKHFVLAAVLLSGVWSGTLWGDSRSSYPSGLEWVRISADKAAFVGAESGERISFWGVNYDHDREGRLLEDYWQDDWNTVVEDFKEIKALRANVVRIHLQVARFLEAPDRPNHSSLERLAQLVHLAEDTGLYLDVTGLGCYHKQDVPAWYDALDERGRWQVQARFWRAVAEVCESSPAVFCYDLINEPILPGKQAETEWLAGELAGKYFVQRIALDLAGRSREEVAGAWVRQMTAAIRPVDSRHLITVGVIPWALVFKGARPLFYSEQVGETLDFVSVHMYPEKGHIDAALTALAVYEVGKPLVIEEMFPLKCSVQEMQTFIARSRAHADGWISFYWGATIHENEHAGDVKGALIGSWLRAFQSMSPLFLDR